MNISSSLFKEIGICLLVGLLLTYRYINLGIAHTQVLCFSFYYSIATFAFFLSRIRFKSAVNPISLFVPFLFLLSYSFIQLSDEQVTYSLKTFLVINISIVMYILFASISYSYKPIKLFILDNNLKRFLFYFICIMAFLTFVAECLIFGYIPMFNFSGLDVYNETNAKLLPFLHYFITLMGFVPAWAYIYLKETVISKREYRFFVFISLLILFNYLSKQSFLLLGVSFFISYTFYNKVNLMFLFKSIIAIVILFLFTGYLRLDSEMSVSAAEYFRAVSGIKNDNISLFEALFVEYSSKRFSVLDEMVNFSDKIGYLGFGIYTFRPLISLFLMEKLNVIQRITELDSERRVGTFLIDPYLDYGLIGVFVITSFYGYLASRYFSQFKEKYPEAIIKFSIILFCILMGMFVNYFNTMFIWLGLLFNKILMSGLQNKKL
jgi:oligosaccharide repeat unit polymerase